MHRVSQESIRQAHYSAKALRLREKGIVEDKKYLVIGSWITPAGVDNHVYVTPRMLCRQYNIPPHLAVFFYPDTDPYHPEYDQLVRVSVMGYHIDVPLDDGTDS